MSHWEAEGGYYRRRRIQSNHHFSLQQRGFLKCCLHPCVINHAHECQNGLMMGSLCGCSLWELQETLCPASDSGLRHGKENNTTIKAYLKAYAGEFSTFVFQLRHNLHYHWIRVFCDFAECRVVSSAVHLYSLILSNTIGLHQIFWFLLIYSWIFNVTEKNHGRNVGAEMISW